MRKLFWLLVGLIITVALAIVLVPWNSVLEGRVKAMLASQGIENSNFTIEKISFNEAIVSNIKLGEDVPFALQSVTLAYTPRELVDGVLRELTITGLALQYTQTDDGWSLAGLPKRDAVGDALTLDSLVAMLPVSKVTVTDSTLTIAGKTIRSTLPLSLTITKTPERSLILDIAATTLTTAKSDIPFGPFHLRAVPADTGNWTGNWTLKSLDLNKLTPIPVLSGIGQLATKGSEITLNGALESADKTYQGAFKMRLDTQKSDAGAITITAASFPFKEGRLSTRNILIPFSGKQPVRVNLDVQKVSVDALLQTLTGKKVTATGTFSGSVPLIISRDGTYTLGKGSLKADSAGTIQMAGDAIPGDNEQVALVRQILENLNYTLLSASVESSGEPEMTVRLSVEGKNPDILEGRPVKLNINLTGDVLDFIQQNIMLITNPEKLLEQQRP